MSTLSGDYEGLQEILTIVRRKYPSAFVAGGAARDTYFNRAIKDYDIIIPQQRVQRSAIQTLSDVFVYLGYKADSFNQYGTLLPTGVGCVKLEDAVNGKDVDIIIREARSLREVLTSFDCNLNKFYFNDDWEVQKDRVNNFGTLQFRDHKLKPDRVIKMLGIAKEVGWETGLNNEVKPGTVGLPGPDVLGPRVEESTETIITNEVMFVS